MGEWGAHHALLLGIVGWGIWIVLGVAAYLSLRRKGKKGGKK